jgi:hypothetical protein
LTSKPDLFDSAPSRPGGFSCWPEAFSRDEERDWVHRIGALPFKPFEFHGYSGKRRIVSFGSHRDKPMFEDVVALSFLSRCRLRLRRRHGARWERWSATIAPRSIYGLRRSIG